MLTSLLNRSRFKIQSLKSLALLPSNSALLPSNSVVGRSRTCTSLFSTALIESESSKNADILSLLPGTFHPGHVMFTLNQVRGKGTELSHQDFRLFLDSARPNYRKDAVVILHAMINHKHMNRFKLDRSLAADCIDQILLCDVENGGLLVIENFTMESGLYYAATLPSLHKAMEHLSEVIEDDSKMELKEKVQKALPSFMGRLLLRRSFPYREMKKRARRRYLAQIQLHDGPSQETIELLVELGLQASNNNVEWVNKELVQPYLDAGHKLDDDMLQAWNMKLLSYNSMIADEVAEKIDS